MKKRNLAGFLFLGFLLLGIMTVGLTGCGNRRYLAAIKETEPEQYSIDGALQWKSGFHWEYFPQNENADDGKIGCFVYIPTR